MSAQSRPAAIIYTHSLLEGSCTFIKSHAEALTRHKAVYAGAHRVAGLELPADRSLVRPWLKPASVDVIQPPVAVVIGLSGVLALLAALHVVTPSAFFLALAPFLLVFLCSILVNGQRRRAGIDRLLGKNQRRTSLP